MRTFKTFALTLFLAKFAASTFTCPKDAEFLKKCAAWDCKDCLFPDPEQPNRFFMCDSAGTGHHMKCPLNLEFSVTEKCCLTAGDPGTPTFNDARLDELKTLKERQESELGIYYTDLLNKLQSLESETKPEETVERSPTAAPSPDESNHDEVTR